MFLEITFPLVISSFTEVGPKFSTNIESSGAGFELRTSNWVHPLHTYRARIDPTNEKALEAVKAFFLVVKGRYTGFRLLDWSDYKVTDATKNVFATTTSGVTTYQLGKVYSFGSYSYVRPIKKPYVSGQVDFPHVSTGSYITDGSEFPDLSLYLDGNLLSRPTDYTIDEKTGLISLATNPGTGKALSASFTFAVPVRFDDDFLAASKDSTNTLAYDVLTFVELRL